MDVHTKQQRSYNMSRIRSKNTKPEIKFRKYVWDNGLRGYRIHSKLPGKPDLYFGKTKVAVFIDGCFWHKCPKCYVPPKSNKKFWREKIEKNIARDIKNDVTLKEMGIDIIRFWDHELKDNVDKCFKKVKKLINKKCSDL